MTPLLLTDERPFREFLRDHGWGRVGYDETAYPEWLRFGTFPHYHKLQGQWCLTPEARRRYRLAPWEPK